MRRLRPLVALLSFAACSPEDLARLEAAHAGSEVHELAHEVWVRFEPGAATLQVRRAFRNDSPEHRSLSRTLAVPFGAVASALRLGVDGRFPEPAQLTTLEDAEARWSDLTGPGEAAPSTLGLLRWEEGSLGLELFALSPGSTAQVEYQLELAPEYAAGEQRFSYPRDEDPASPAPRFTSQAGPLLQALEGAAPEEAEAGAFLLRQRHEPREVLEARWATSPLDTGRTLWRLELDAAARLGEAPVRPNVVFVLDASHSEGPEGIAAQLELVAPYLENARDAAVEVVVYRRFAQRLFGRFVPAREVPALLAAAGLPPGNGSHLERGLALASELLAQVGGPARVVLFTDERLRTGFSLEAAAAALLPAPRDTVLHVVARTHSGGGLLLQHRDDEAALAPLAAGTGGVFFRVDGRPQGALRDADALLELVRPTRIERLEVEAPGLGEEQLEVPDVLVEGEAVRLLALAPAPPEEIAVTGTVWARPFRAVVRADARLAQRLPGLAVGDETVRGELSDDELRTAAFLARAVSPVTAYLCAPQGAAPSTVGVAEEPLALGGLFGIGCGGASGSSSCGGFGTARPRVDLEAQLEALLRPAAEACGARGGATLTLEATGDEVVEVTAGAAAPGLAGCLEAAGWALRLPPAFTDHRTYSLRFP